MNDAVANRLSATDGWTPGPRLAREVGLVAGRLAAFLRSRFGDGNTSLKSTLVFLDSVFKQAGEGRPLSEWTGGALERRPVNGPHPFDRLADALGLSPCETDLVMLAGMAEEHEGYADIFRTLHPNGDPRPTAGLAAQLLCTTVEDRALLRRLLTIGPALASGLIGLEGEGPFFNRNLVLAEGIWPVLHGIDAWPARIPRDTGIVATQGLSAWLREPGVAAALDAVAGGAPCTVLMTADDEETAFRRAGALVHTAGVGTVRIRWPVDADGDLEPLVTLHALARGLIPIVGIPQVDGPGEVPVPAFSDYPAAVVISARSGAAALNTPRPLINILLEHLGPTALRDMWTATLPHLSQHATVLAARYPVEPGAALQVAVDLGFQGHPGGRDAGLDDVAAAIRARATTRLRGGVQLVRPSASWENLVLPPAPMSQLREAVDRLYLQGRVLDDWRFLEGRRGARGVRMLFAGPSGTGKTLSAEVLAKALDVDMLLVDLSRVVSKWIGETEKNLAEVFETAERAKAVLVFDEADALFGKRTEVSDAHDRYANLETAYLLSRLERFDGLAILSTNLRENIDPAFTRRLEFVVGYDEPGRDQRRALWRCHLPDDVPLADDVNLNELAAHFPIVGGLIRNAAVAAAFLAAAENGPIRRDHFIKAVRREYEKAGKAFRDLPAVVSR